MLLGVSMILCRYLGTFEYFIGELCMWIDTVGPVCQVDRMNLVILS